MSYWRSWRMLHAAQGRGGALAVLRRFTWELPQTLLGLLIGNYVLLTWEVDAIWIYDGVAVIRGFRRRLGWGGVCFGSVILGDDRIEATVNNRLFMHEFGHTLQSRASGPIYLFKYGIPSVLSAWGKGIHSNHPVERDANARAAAYFCTDPQFTAWPDHYHPLPDAARRLQIVWWEFIPPIFPFRHLWQALRDRDGSATR